jgi:hypothetical protein
MANLYRIIGTSFFSALSSRNRDVYLDCLFILHDVLDDLYQEEQNTKPNVTSLIEDYLNSKIDTTIYEEDDSVANLRGNREKANYILNLLIKQKWLFEEDLGNYSVAINFYNHSSRIIRILKEIESNDQTEYTGLISTIYLSLKNFSYNDIGQFEQIYKRTDELISNLKTLRSNIYLYYNDMIKNKSKENLEELFEQLISYKKKFFDKAFYNLQTKDTLKKYKYDILVYLNQIIENKDAINQLTKLSISDKYPTEEEANNFILMKLHTVLAAFENIDRLNHSISERSEQYINALISKIQYILNRSEDIEGIFNQIFDLVINDEIEEFDFIKILDTSTLDISSMYTPRKISEKINTSILPFEMLHIDEKSKQETIEELLSNKKYSLDSINSHVIDILRDDIKIKASDLDLSTYDNYIYLILIYLYSRNLEAKYEISPLDEEVSIGKVHFKNFEIVRKKNE